MLPLEGRSVSIFVVTTVFLGISFITVCLRCFVRLRLVKAFGWDDGFMVCAMVCQHSFYAQELALMNLQLINILFAICGITGSFYGLGQKSHVLLERRTMETAMFVGSPSKITFTDEMNITC